jgi:hypothetical protein
MARTIEQIYDDIIAEKDSKATLSGLLPADADFQDLYNDITTQSKASQWRLWVYIHAYATFVLESLFELFKKDVEVIKRQSIFGTEQWWIDRIFEFQLGYNVQILEANGRYNIGYEIIDENARIIKAAALFTNDLGQSIIKVAKEESGELTKLDPAEITSINAYRDKIQPAGASIEVISLNADDCEIIANVYYNALFDLSVVKTQVEAAINNYFRNLDFGGIVLTNSIIDAVQELEPINDFFITSIKAASSGQPLTNVTRRYEASAGYIKINGGLSLEDGLNYIAQ